MRFFLTVLACSMTFGILFYAIACMTLEPELTDINALPSGTPHALPPVYGEDMRTDVMVVTIAGVFTGAVVGFLKS